VLTHERGCRTDAQTIRWPRHRRPGYSLKIDPATLAVLAEWNSRASYLQRLTNLQNAPVTRSGQTVNPNESYRAGYYINAATVQDNGVSDHLVGTGDDQPRLIADAFVVPDEALEFVPGPLRHAARVT
jgi:hypothetical protein